MRKALKRIFFCLILTISLWCGNLLADRSVLNDSIIRLHVVADSDSEQDQKIKLYVRDAVLEGLEEDLHKAADVEAAKEYLQESLPKVKALAEDALKKLGCSDGFQVSLCKEAFDTRVYDTFTLPAGVYDALWITIGEGAGKNWWCVVFPALCVPAASEEFRDVAVGSGFSEGLSRSLAETETYDLRFYCLDALGKLENMLFQG